VLRAHSLLSALDSCVSVYLLGARCENQNETTKPEFGSQLLISKDQPPQQSANPGTSVGLWPPPRAKTDTENGVPRMRDQAQAHNVAPEAGEGAVFEGLGGIVTKRNLLSVICPRPSARVGARCG
jgi:hypothetical protein